MDGIKNCPMCGEQPELIETTFLHDTATMGAVHCTRCNYVATNSNTQTAIDLWNKINTGPSSGPSTPPSGQ